MQCTIHALLRILMYINGMHTYTHSLLMHSTVIVRLYLNQARAGHRLACAWFLKIDPERIVDMHACVHVCVSVPEAINN